MKPTRNPIKADLQTRLMLANHLSNIGFWTWHIAERRFEADRAMRTMFGLRQEDSLDMEVLFELIHPEDRDGIREAIFGAHKRGHDLTLLYRVVLLDGRTRWLKTLCRFYSDEDGKPAMLVAASRDTTEEKRLQEQLARARRFERAGRLARGAAQDFSNVMTAMEGYLSLLEEQFEGDEDVGPLIQDMRQVTQRANVITRQLQATGAPTPSQPSQEEIGTEELFRTFEDTIPRLLGPDIHWTLITHNIKTSVQCDPAQVERVMTSLALRASRTVNQGGQFRVQATLQRLSSHNAERLPAGPYLVLKVEDDGDPLTQVTLDLFDSPMFTSGTPSHERDLAMHMAALRKNGGLVTAAKDMLLGARFQLYLPCKAPPPPTTRDLRRNKTLLLVEDDPILRKLIKTILNRHGYKVLTAIHGEEALELFEEHSGKVDLLLTDVIMPGIKGTELHDIVRKQHPEMKVLFITGYAPSSLNLDRHNSHLLCKPFTIDQLLERVREALQGL